MNYNDLKQLIREELSKITDEVTASSIGVGEKFRLLADLGKLEKEDKVEATSVKYIGGDEMYITLSNGKVSDTFRLDRNDTLELTRIP